MIWMLRHRTDFTFTGSDYRPVKFNRGGANGLLCFHKFESTGVLLETRHPNILSGLLRVKASINFQIKEWAQDRASGLLPKILFDEIIKEYNLPEWVAKAVEKQKVKYY